MLKCLDIYYYLEYHENNVCVSGVLFLVYQRRQWPLQQQEQIYAQRQTQSRTDNEVQGTQSGVSPNRKYSISLEKQ